MRNDKVHARDAELWRTPTRYSLIASCSDHFVLDLLLPVAEEQRSVDAAPSYTCAHSQACCLAMQVRQCLTHVSHLQDPESPKPKGCLKGNHRR